jgi:HSP20 family molecular chaperone IbpA
MMDDFDRRILDEFQKLERQMGRMLRSTSLSRTTPMTSSRGWQPDVDVYETSEDIIVLMDTAGIDMDTMSASAEKSSITVQGRRSLPKRGHVCCIHQLEIETGFFKRTITFPVSIQVAATTFSCKNGILEIKMPKDLKNCSLP